MTLRTTTHADYAVNMDLEPIRAGSSIWDLPTDKVYYMLQGNGTPTYPSGNDPHHLFARWFQAVEAMMLEIGHAPPLLMEPRLTDHPEHWIIPPFFWREMRRTKQMAWIMHAADALEMASARPLGDVAEAAWERTHLRNADGTAPGFIRRAWMPVKPPRVAPS